MPTARSIPHHRAAHPAPPARPRRLRRALVALPAAAVLVAGSVVLVPAAQAAAPATTSAAVAGSSETVPLLRVGSRGPGVRSWQQDLNTFRSVTRRPGVPGVARGEHPAMPAIAVDGVFGPGTVAATRDFQAYAGLAADGIVGEGTRSAWARTVGTGNTAAQGRDITTVLRRGSSGTQVRTWQQDVNRFFAHTRSRGSQGELGAAPDITVDGIFGPGTAAATRDLQSFTGVTADGVVGQRTLAAYGALGLG